jgi:hypothetical protein
MRLTAFDFFADPTRAAVATFDGDVWLVSGIDADLDELRWRRFAAGLFQPLGIRIVEDTVYVLGRDQITRLHDRNGDGEADYYENFNNDCMVAPNFHEFAVNLETDAEGNFYYGKCASWPPVVRTAHEGSLLRVSRDGSELEVIATGLRNPNGLAFGPSGRLALSDNEGHWTPACWVGFAERGDYFGVRFTAHRDPPPERYREPVSFLPRDLDNSIGDVVWVEGKRWGPLEGHLLALSYGKCTLFQVLLDEADGQAQGGVIPFPQRFLSGIMRARFNPGDGQLYVLGMRGWQTSANREGCFQRVRYTGEPVHTVTRARATAEGLVLTFTNPLDPRSAGDARRYSAERWNYVRSAEYGSAEYSVASPGARGRDPVEIAGAELREDRRTVLLRIPGMAPVDMLRIRCRIRAADGAQVSLDIYNSVRQLAESP